MVAACSTMPRGADALQRCIWVDRWDYHSAADIDAIMANCQRQGFSAVMFQVRGNGTVAFRSSLEVWSERYGFKDPGFDPLARAVAAAHQHGLQLHAWVNLLPGWVGNQPPADARQLWRSRRDWFLQTRDNQFQQQRPGKYLALNPCLPEVRRYLAQLCGEIASRYPVDGVHLDYVRFPDEPDDDPEQLGTDPGTLSLFTGATGRAVSERQALHAWQVRCVTALVQQVREAIAVPDRHVALTAAVFADPQQALAKVRQDWGDWCRRGLLDAVLPMDYTADDAQFSARARAAVLHAGGAAVVVGVGAYRHSSSDQTIRQLDAAHAAGARGVAVFNYRALFGAALPGAPPPEELRRRVGSWLTTAGSR